MDWFDLAIQGMLALNVRLGNHHVLGRCNAAFFAPLGGSAALVHMPLFPFQSFLVGVVVPDPDALPSFAAKIGVKGSIEELCQNQVSLTQESLCTPMGLLWEGDSLFSPSFNLGTQGFSEPPLWKNRLLLCLYWLVLLDWKMGCRV